MYFDFVSNRWPSATNLDLCPRYAEHRKSTLLQLCRWRTGDNIWSHIVEATHIVDKSGHQFVVENIFIQVATARPCQEGNIVGSDVYGLQAILP